MQSLLGKKTICMTLTEVINSDVKEATLYNDESDEIFIVRAVYMIMSV